MKGLGKLVVSFCLVTGVLLLYVHERVEMLRLSYRIYERSAEFSIRAEELRRLKFEVAQLRSPQSLEKRLDELSLPLTLPKEIKVLKMPSEPVESLAKTLPLPVPSHKLFQFLGQWIQVAQARTDQ